MKRALLGAALILAFWMGGAPAAGGAGAPDADFRQELDSIMGELSKITGLRQKRPVAYERIGKGEVKRYLEQRIKELVKPEEIRAEELVLKKFGFVPADFDLRETTLDLLSEQAAAFYDFKKRRMFLIEAAAGDGPPEGMQHSALVHELAHALADQNFKLEDFIEPESDEDDGSLARMAVMEGQATWLMSEYLTRRTGQSLLESPELARMMGRATTVSAGQYPVYDRSPLYLRESLMFPYIQGFAFQQAVLEKLGVRGFAEIFRRPPVSTQQILHPEKYLEGVKPATPVLPSLVTKREYKGVTKGAVGEFDHGILLRQHVGEKEAASVAPSWKGGFFEVLEHKKNGNAALLYASEWESAEKAREFFDLYRKVQDGKWKVYEVEGEAPGLVVGRGDDGYFAVRLEGTRVSVAEGLRSPDELPPAFRAGTLKWKETEEKCHLVGLSVQ